MVPELDEKKSYRSLLPKVVLLEKPNCDAHLQIEFTFVVMNLHQILEIAGFGMDSFLVEQIQVGITK